MAIQIRVQVFTDDAGRGGSPLLIVLDSAVLDDSQCASIAAASGTSETVFVDGREEGTVRIFVPAGRIPFAGYPLIGAGWLLHQLGHPVDALITDAGAVPIRANEAGCAITTAPGRGNPWTLIHAPSLEALTAMDADGADRHDYAWTWTDEPAGQVRARAFTSASGVPEDEATGSAAIELAHHLGRDLEITQGRGSKIRARCLGEVVELQGRCTRARAADDAHD